MHTRQLRTIHTTTTTIHKTINNKTQKTTTTEQTRQLQYTRELQQYKQDNYNNTQLQKYTTTIVHT